MLHDGQEPRSPPASTGRLSRRRFLQIGAVAAAGSTAAAALAACGESQIVAVEKIVTQTEIKEIPVEKVVTQTVVKEVPVERVVEKIVTVEKLIPPTQQSVTVYSGRSESLVAPVLAQFGEISGVDVRIKYAGTPALAATLLEEGSNSPADLFYAQDPGGLGAVEPLFAPLPQDILERSPAWGRHADGLWTGVTGRARTVVYNNRKFTEADLPDDMFGFHDPAWRGRIGWAPTNGSFQAMVTGMRAVWGEDRASEWLQGIKANQPIEFPKNTPQVAAAAAGEIDVGFVNHYYLHRFMSEQGESFNARNYHVRGGGPGALIMVSGAGVLASAANPEPAQALIRFLLSDVGQSYFVSNTFEYPMAPGVKTHPGVTPLDSINRPDIAPSQLTDLKGTQALLRQLEILP
ncbi:MAG: extracellular solute-binding protein [Chloroflexota bacterium]|nr:extracellular solute-binding protein [Chloroflexota bacterium]